MAPRKKQKCAKKNPVRKSPKIKKLASCCNGRSISSAKTKQSKSTTIKPNAKCPYCKGVGRVAKKKGRGNKKKPTSYFPYFFQHIAKRARDNNVVQNRKITMQRAAQCWRSLTQEQKTEFIQKVQQNLGIAGGRPQRGSGPPAPGHGEAAPRSENHRNAKGTMKGYRGKTFDEESRQDARPAASEHVLKSVSPSKNPKSGKPGNGEDVPNAPKDENEVPFSPFGFFSHLHPTGDSM